MKLQRQHFLLSYLKTLSVGPVGVSNSQPPASQPGEQPSELPVGGKTYVNNRFNTLRDKYVFFLLENKYGICLFQYLICN